MTNMQNPSHEEAIELIRMKRYRAKTAMDRIVKRLSVIMNAPLPGMETLLDYYSNMIYALELLLKVLANDWRNPNKSYFGHRIGDMYNEVFGRPHQNVCFIDAIERAILNQKFLLEPATSLLDYLPELEELWDELNVEYEKRNWMKVNDVVNQVVLPTRAIDYLQENLHRFYKDKTHQITRSGNASAHTTNEYRDRLRSAKLTLSRNREIWKDEFTFGISSHSCIVSYILDSYVEFPSPNELS